MLDTWRKVVDDPIPPLQSFSHYLKSAYGVENARIMVATQADALEAIVAAGGDLGRARAAEITCPALLITGEHDVFAPPGLVSEMAAAMPSAEFTEVEDAGHPLHHTNSAWLVTTVVDWLLAH
jgi:pimeloyl-ACP methyl ester carboxylesterase